MPRRKSSRSGLPRKLLWLAAAALTLFIAGEAWFLLRSDAGRLTLGRAGLGDRAALTRIVGRHAHQALEEAGVSRDSIRESVVARGAAPVAWRVGLRPGASTLQVHSTLAAALEAEGAHVLSGRERPGPSGDTQVRLVIGVGRLATHEITLVLPPPWRDAPLPESGKIALVLFGFGEGDSLARACFALPAPFAAAIVPGAKSSATQFALAHAKSREVVLHLPLEPMNYPQINPGPGTILVTFTPSQIAGRVRKYVEQAGPVIAVANHMGSLATQDMTVMTAVYHELKRERLPFLHVNPAPGSVCKSLASELGVAYDEPDAVIEPDSRSADTKALERRWKELLALSRDHGSIVVWVRATPATAAWLKTAADPKKLGGVSLVPLSSLLRRPTGG
jgi:polysaccharide deacetylase 2 family uncharacterized protein YibQ